VYWGLCGPPEESHRGLSWKSTGKIDSALSHAGHGDQLRRWEWVRRRQVSESWGHLLEGGCTLVLGGWEGHAELRMVGQL
jgi:hypothetical protein